MRIQKADNGLYQAKLALAGVGQNELLIESTSGILQGNIESSSGTLDGNINTVSSNLNTVSGNVDKLLAYSRFDIARREYRGSGPSAAIFISALNTNVELSSPFDLDSIANRNTIFLLHFSYSSVFSGGNPSCAIEGSTSDPDSWSSFVGPSLHSVTSGETYSALRTFEVQSGSTDGKLALRFRVGGVTTLTNFIIHFIDFFAIQGPPENGY